MNAAIHSAAGPELYAACYAVPEVTRGVRCPTGSAVITGGFNLPASKVIHTVGPIYSSDEVSAEPLAKAYRYYFFESTIARLLREAIIVLYRFVLCSFLLEAT
jgi:O-acetyl-ADP-ribose deacetylase (regulator of RNase III)